jgi:hypothetical protein
MSEVLNLVLRVQSKASGLPYPAETETGFQSSCRSSSHHSVRSAAATVRAERSRARVLHA